VLLDFEEVILDRLKEEGDCSVCVYAGISKRLYFLNAACGGT
jgi:hypothetical protein